MSDEVTPPVVAKPAQPEPETFSKDYVRELRAENANYRTRAQDAEKKAADAATAIAEAKTAADASIKTLSDAATQKIIRAELKASALKAGMIDLDGLKLADLSKVKLNDETGEVEGAEDLMKALKETKSYLFGTTQSSTSTTGKPDPQKPEIVDMTKLTDAEYRAARNKAVRTR